MTESYQAIVLYIEHSLCSIPEVLVEQRFVKRTRLILLDFIRPFAYLSFFFWFQTQKAVYEFCESVK